VTDGHLHQVDCPGRDGRLGLDDLLEWGECPQIRGAVAELGVLSSPEDLAVLGGLPSRDDSPDSGDLQHQDECLRPEDCRFPVDCRGSAGLCWVGNQDARRLQNRLLPGGLSEVTGDSAVSRHSVAPTVLWRESALHWDD
jgi:hypothetical protein